MRLTWEGFQSWGRLAMFTQSSWSSWRSATSFCRSACIASCDFHCILHALWTSRCAADSDLRKYELVYLPRRPAWLCVHCQKILACENHLLQIAMMYCPAVLSHTYVVSCTYCCNCKQLIGLSLESVHKFQKQPRTEDRCKG